MCWSLFLIMLQASRPATLLRRDSNTGVFLSNLRNVRNTFFTEHLRWLLLKLNICFSYRLLHIRIGNLDWNKSHEEKTKHIHASAAHLLHIRIGNLDWYKSVHCKNEAREIDSLCCREVNAMIIASAKIPELEGSISPCRFYG